MANVKQCQDVQPPHQQMKPTGEYSTTLKEALENTSCMAGRLTCLFPSASAQDLRCFQVEKERHDQASPRGVVEACIQYMEKKEKDKDSGSPKKCSTPSEPESSHSPAHSRWHKFFRLWKHRTVKRLPTFPPFGSRRMSDNHRESMETDHSPDHSSAWKNFSLSELKHATNNFSQDNLIGIGGFAQVYKGCLPNGDLVAIKMLNKGTSEDQMINFLSEIGIIAHVNHPNTAKMVGYGTQGGTFLVLQLSSLGSLGTFLHGSKKKLNWEARYKIVRGTAEGLLYLHENCQRRIIHRDIKSDNVLLTDSFEPQICDFGLAKWLPKQMTHYTVSKFEGTFGYFAPEYYMNGIVDEKTDVFAFGVLLLEVITRRRALDKLQNSLVLWARPLLDQNKLDELVDPSLGDEYNKEEMDRVVLAAGSCIEPNSLERPRMNKVVAMLGGDANSLEHYKERQHRKHLQRTYSEELHDANEYNSTKILTDINKLKGIALGS